MFMVVLVFDVFVLFEGFWSVKVFNDDGVVNDYCNW